MNLTPLQEAARSMDQQYSIGVACTNCGWKGKLWFDKGVTAFVANGKCQRCECCCLIRTIGE